MKYLRHYTEKAQSKALEENGAFWAFGSEQFNKFKKPDVKYVGLGSGLCCPKENAEKLMKELDIALDNGIKEDVKENGFRKIVRREYFNYETQISMDNQHVVNRLDAYIRLFPEEFTEEAILKVCRECFNEAVENDMF